MSDIAAIRQIHSLTNGEAMLIRAMSIAYIEGLRDGENPFAIEPWELSND